MSTRKAKPRPRFVVPAILFLLTSWSCGSVPPGNPHGADTSEDDLVRSCGAVKFEEDRSNYGIEKTDIFFVRSFHGRVLARSGYRWPEEGVPVQVYSLGEEVFYKFRTDSEGYFEISTLPNGKYCYLVSFDGWQSEKGQFVVRKDSATDKPREVMLLLDM